MVTNIADVVDTALTFLGPVMVLAWLSAIVYTYARGLTQLAGLLTLLTLFIGGAVYLNEVRG